MDTPGEMARDNPDVDRRNRSRKTPVMNPRELKIVSALAVFLTAGLPAVAGMIAFRAQPVLAGGLIGEPGGLPPLTGFYFNHFKEALVLLFLCGVGATWIALRSHREQKSDDTSRMARLLATTCFSALVSVLFLGLLILATVLPLYTRLTAR